MIADTKPLDYVKAARDAGYDGIGLGCRITAISYDPIVGDAPLIRDIMRVLADASMTVLDILPFMCSHRAASRILSLLVQSLPNWFAVSGDTERRRRLEPACDKWAGFMNWRWAMARHR